MLVGEVFARMGLDSKEYEKSLDRLENVTKKRALTLGNIFKGAFSFTLGMGLFQGLQAGTGMLKDFIITAMQTETYEVAMDAVARATGTSTDALKQQKKAVMDLGVAGQEATQVLTRFMQSQLDIRYATKLTRVAQDAATIAGENSSEATMKITEAIAKLQPELLNQYGMTRNLNDIYNDYGRTLGKKANQLSEVEKKQAMLNYILKEGEKIAGSYEAAMGTVGKQLGSMEKLMLPKKLMQEFKTELAGPLIMPAFSVLVDNIIAGIEKMKAWVVDNKEMLRAWGETIKQAVQGVWKTFSGFFSFMLNNAGTLIPLIGAVAKFAFSYLVATTAINLARKATELFSLATLAMKGSLKDGPALFQLISRAVGIYRLQLRLAAMEGITVTGVMAKLRIALYSLKAAIGPIGWITIALSLLVAASLWVAKSWDQVKYYGLQTWGALKTGIGYAVYGIIGFFRALIGWIPGIGNALAKAQQSVLRFATRERGVLAKRKSSYIDANKPVDEMAEKMNKLGALANKGTKAIDDQSNAMKDAGKATKKAGKEAKGGLMGFDEINQLMNQTADAADDVAGGIGDVGGVGDIGGIGDIGDVGGLGSDDLLADMDGILGGVDKKNKSFWPKLWSGIKKGAKFGWDAIKLVLGTTWDGLCGLGKQVWSDFGGWMGGLWDGVGEKWGGFTDGVGEKWSGFKIRSGEIWEGVKTTVSEKWNGLKTNASETWSNLKTTIGDGWDAIKTKSGSTWDTVKTYVSNKWGDLKTGAAGTWNTLKTTVGDGWENIKQNTGTTWENIRTTVSSKWDNLKINASTTWSNISSTIQSKWNNLKSSAPGTWETIRSSIVGKWNSLNTSAGTIWNNIKNTISSRLNNIKNLFNFRWSLPRIKLPHFYVSWSFGGYLGKAAEFLGLPGIPRFSVSWYKEGGIFSQPSIIGVGEAGAEAVVPLDRLTELFASALRQVLSEERPAVAGAGGGDITIPIYIGNELLETIIVKAQDRRNTRSNGR